MSKGSSAASKSPCARLVLAIFGGLFLVAFLSVPVTTSTSQLRQDPASSVVFKMTYPKNSTMFLPSYLAAKSGPRSGEVRLRSTQWLGTMGVVAVLGVFDGVALCRILRRRRRRAASDESEEAGLSLFP